MTQSQRAFQAQAGDFLRNYKPRTNFNSIINLFYRKRVAFLPAQLAFLKTEVQFPDVSFYQGEIDFDVMATKTRAIILRAGQGTYKDEQFDRNYAEARRVGLLVGVYWFYDDRVDPRKQAETLIRILGGKTIEMEVFIDWENSYGGQFKGLANVVAMMQLIDNLGYEIGMYTGYYWFRENSNLITNAGQYAYLKTKPLWEAWYTTNPANVLIPAPWSELTHWQWGTPAVAWGQKSREMDMNYPDMTEKEFDDRYGINQGEPTTMSFMITPDKSIGSKIRNDHFISSLQIGSLIFGNFGYGTDTYWGDGVMEKWWHVKEYENAQGARVPMDGWVAERSGGTKVATSTVINDPPPPTPTLPDLPYTVILGDDVTYNKVVISGVLIPKV